MNLISVIKELKNLVLKNRKNEHVLITFESKRIREKSREVWNAHALPIGEYLERNFFFYFTKKDVEKDIRRDIAIKTLCLAINLSFGFIMHWSLLRKPKNFPNDIIIFISVYQLLSPVYGSSLSLIITVSVTEVWPFFFHHFFFIRYYFFSNDHIATYIQFF